MAHGALRVAEVVGLEWRHIDLDEGVIEIVDKGGKAASVDMTPTLRDVLGQCPAIKQGALFPFGAARARQRIKRLCERNRVTYKGCHALRQYHGMRLAAQTNNIDVVQQRLRHEHRSSTDLSTRMSSRVLREALTEW